MGIGEDGGVTDGREEEEPRREESGDWGEETGGTTGKGRTPKLERIDIEEADARILKRRD